MSWYRWRVTDPLLLELIAERIGMKDEELTRKEES